MALKKRKKRILIITIILIASIIVIAVFFLLGEYSKEKQEYEALLKQQTETLTKALVSELDQINTSDEGLTAADNPNANLAPTEVPAEVITDTEKQVIGQELAKLEDERKQKVLQTLSASYSQALNQQKEEAFAMVDDLVAQAKKDWASIGKDNSDDSALKRGALITEYLAKSKVVEEQMDASFNILISKMEDQLNSEGIDPTEIIAKYKEEYKEIKEENRTIMLEKAWAAVKN